MDQWVEEPVVVKKSAQFRTGTVGGAITNTVAVMINMATIVTA